MKNFSGKIFNSDDYYSNSINKCIFGFMNLELPCYWFRSSQIPMRGITQTFNPDFN